MTRQTGWLQCAPRGQRFALCHFVLESAWKRGIFSSLRGIPSERASMPTPNQNGSRRLPRGEYKGGAFLVRSRRIFVYFVYFVVMKPVFAGPDHAESQGFLLTFLQEQETLIATGYPQEPSI
jgi:hypothetical protein